MAGNMSEAYREAINRARSRETSNNPYLNWSGTNSGGTQASTFTQPSYTPGALAPVTNADGTISQRMPTQYWIELLQSRSKGATPYLYPKPPPQFRPVAYNADDPRFQPSWEVRQGDNATVVDGYVSDSLRASPVGEDGKSVGDIPISWQDPMYRKVANDSEGVNAKIEFGKLSMFEKDAWKNAALALGGGSRNAESTFALYFAKSADAGAVGDNLTAWDFLMGDIQSGYMPMEILGGPGALDDSGGGGYGGGGGGGGGGQVNLMNENDARAVVNSIASPLLGRTVTEKEFQRYYKDILQLQRDNPSTIEFGDDGTQTVNQSIGAEGIGYNIEEQMRNTEDFVTNSIGTQALDLLEAYIAKRSL